MVICDRYRARNASGHVRLVVGKTNPRAKERLVELGERLRRLRRRLGVSRAVIAARIGMEARNYARIEQGKQNVTVEMLLRIADGLGVEFLMDFKMPRKRS